MPGAPANMLVLAALVAVGAVVVVGEAAAVALAGRAGLVWRVLALVRRRGPGAGGGHAVGTARHAPPVQAAVVLAVAPVGGGCCRELSLQAGALLGQRVQRGRGDVVADASSHHRPDGPAWAPRRASGGAAGDVGNDGTGPAGCGGVRAHSRGVSLTPAQQRAERDGPVAEVRRTHRPGSWPRGSAQRGSSMCGGERSHCHVNPRRCAVELAAHARQAREGRSVDDATVADLPGSLTQTPWRCVVCAIHSYPMARMRRAWRTLQQVWMTMAASQRR